MGVMGVGGRAEMTRVLSVRTIHRNALSLRALCGNSSLMRHSTPLPAQCWVFSAGPIRLRAFLVLSLCLFFSLVHSKYWTIVIAIVNIIFYLTTFGEYSLISLFWYFYFSLSLSLSLSISISQSLSLSLSLFFFLPLPLFLPLCFSLSLSTLFCSFSYSIRFLSCSFIFSSLLFFIFFFCSNTLLCLLLACGVFINGSSMLANSFQKPKHQGSSTRYFSFFNFVPRRSIWCRVFYSIRTELWNSHIAHVLTSYSPIVSSLSSFSKHSSSPHMIVSHSEVEEFVEVSFFLSGQCICFRDIGLKKGFFWCLVIEKMIIKNAVDFTDSEWNIFWNERNFFLQKQFSIFAGFFHREFIFIFVNFRIISVYNSCSMRQNGRCHSFIGWFHCCSLPIFVLDSLLSSIIYMVPCTWDHLWCVGLNGVSASSPLLPLPFVLFPCMLWWCFVVMVRYDGRLFVFYLPHELFFDFRLTFGPSLLFFWVSYRSLGVFFLAFRFFTLVVVSFLFEFFILFFFSYSSIFVSFLID